jgi:hypothetical protein
MDQTSICNLCNRSVPVQGLCNKCHSSIHSQLDDLKQFWLTAHDELIPSRTGSGGRSSDPSIGLNVAALSFIAGHDILGLLHEWEGLIREKRNLTPPALLVKPSSLETEIDDAIKFAQSHLAWSGTQDWIGDFANELKQLHSMGMGAAKLFVKRSRKIACPSDRSDGTPCQKYLPINADDPLAIFQCKGCGTQWTTLRLVAVALSDPTRQVWLDAEAIGNWMGISERHVHRIAKANRVARKGQLYDVKAMRDAHARNS